MRPKRLDTAEHSERGPTPAALAAKIRRVAERRTKALKAAAEAHAELLPLLERAQVEYLPSGDPNPEHISVRQLDGLTGITWGYIPQLLKRYREKQAMSGTERANE